MSLGVYDAHTGKYKEVLAESEMKDLSAAIEQRSFVGDGPSLKAVIQSMKTEDWEAGTPGLARAWERVANSPETQQKNKAVSLEALQAAMKAIEMTNRKRLSGL